MLDNKGEKIPNRLKGGFIHISRDDDEITIGDHSYNTLVMESDYEDSWQISGHEGELIIFDLVTYGYGEEISWEDLQMRVNDMETWAKLRGLDYKVSISANYW